MRERLCSAWTVTLHYQTITTLARAMRRLGCAVPAAEFEVSAAFADRYAALAQYDKVKNSAVELEGGWHIYSNGKELSLTREANPYRTGVPRCQWQRYWSG